MNTGKFVQMVREFPFLTSILFSQRLSADAIGSIEVMLGDRNLLEVTPSAWAHDAGECGNHTGHRLFWCVTPGEVSQEALQLRSSWSRTIPFERNDQQGVTPIGSQLLSLNRDILFIVEIRAEGWNWEDRTSEIVIYKMFGFDWLSCCGRFVTKTNMK